jgi:YidC/Oxa1 family membrane protein insertase
VQNIDYCRTEDNAVVGIEPDQKDFPAGQDQSVRWIGLSNTYFACLLIPKTPFATGNLFGRRAVPPEEGRKAKGDQRYILGTAGKLGDVELEAGVEKSWTFTYYAGPKAITMLEILDPQAAGIMRVAWWSWLEWISQMLLKLLIWLKLHCGSYGLSIILLTVMVRACFWPITQKANSSMRRMQKLQPELKALREKYKDNQQELNRKTWQLYQQHKVNPLGGCLPILLQIPVFFALYQTLESSIELRHIPFLWATDLSRPDTIAQILGLKIHPFILMMTVLMMAQQYLTPTAGDPVQQKMLMFMPLIMLIFLYDLPAGLTLYWTVSQIISIMQLLINQHFATRGEPLKPATQT